MASAYIVIFACSLFLVTYMIGVSIGRSYERKRLLNEIEGIFNRLLLLESNNDHAAVKSLLEDLCSDDIDLMQSSDKKTGSDLIEEDEDPFSDYQESRSVEDLPNIKKVN